MLIRLYRLQSYFKYTRIWYTSILYNTFSYCLSSSSQTSKTCFSEEHNSTEYPTRFILILIPLVCAMPTVVLNEIMNCEKASNSKSLPYLMLVFGSILGLIPTSLSFFYHIYPADVYMVAFWNSPVGRFLRMLRRKLIQIYRRLNNTSRATA